MSTDETDLSPDEIEKLRSTLEKGIRRMRRVAGDLPKVDQAARPKLVTRLNQLQRRFIREDDLLKSHGVTDLSIPDEDLAWARNADWNSEDGIAWAIGTSKWGLLSALKSPYRDTADTTHALLTDLENAASHPIALLNAPSNMAIERQVEITSARGLAYLSNSAQLITALDSHQHYVVDRLRRLRVTWKEIGDALGVAPQSAQRRFKKDEDPEMATIDNSS